MALKISSMIREEDNVIVLSLEGSLDTDTYQQLKDKAFSQLDKSPKALILDLKSLDYISSMGISALLEIRKKAEVAKSGFMMSNVPAHIDHVFKIVNALPDVRIFASIEEADKYFMEIQNQVKARGE